MKNFTQILAYSALLLSFNSFAQDGDIASADQKSVLVSNSKHLQNNVSINLDNSPKEIEKNKVSLDTLYKLSEDQKIIDGYNPPSYFFKLSDWSLSVPEDKDENGKADQIKENELSDGYLSDYFYATDDGAMVFTCPIGGAKTSKNTKYTRSELREMLRAGNTSIKTKGPNKNNWVLESSKSAKNAGGFNGELEATLAVNYVTTTGKDSQVGRVVIGQIHAKDNEPLRIYYRKLPNNDKGSIYFAHETNTGEEDYYELIGSKSSSAKNPEDGIALDEKFTYKVSLINNELTVKISRPFGTEITKVINIENSGYNKPDEYMYFKAGVYNQNKSGDPNDYVKATFYELFNSHDGNYFNF